MINGILNIYKEKGWTSHDVVARLRGIVGQKKIGHTGTLDPDAEGVLPVCLGRATKVCDLLTDKDKTYETVLLLGKTTDTQDITGTVLAEQQTAGITEEDVLAPMYGYRVGEQDTPIFITWSAKAGKSSSMISGWKNSVSRECAWKWTAPKGLISARSAMISERNWAWEDAWSRFSAPAWEDSVWKRACGWQMWRIM